MLLQRVRRAMLGRLRVRRRRRRPQPPPCSGAGGGAGSGGGALSCRVRQVWRPVWRPRQMDVLHDTPVLSARSIAEPTNPHLVLVRDYIDTVLYSRHKGYFNSGERIHSLESPIQFTEIADCSEYQHMVDTLYESHAEAWLTPVELFQPVFAESILKWMLSSRKNQEQPLQIVEIGCGAGTCALNILDKLRSTHPRLYDNTLFTMVDISQQYSKHEQKRLWHHGHQKQTRFLNCSGADLPSLNEYKRDVPTFVIGLEVLDNLPHDKVVYFEDSSQAEGRLMQVMVDISGDEPVERYVPISDPLVSELVRMDQEIDASECNVTKDMTSALGRLFAGISRGWSRATHPNGVAIREVFLPTVCLALFKQIQLRVPNHHVMFADFSMLPDTIAGQNAPVVAEKSYSSGGETIDHSTYLVEEGQADIFFPTDFEKLRQRYERIHGRPAMVQSTTEFMTTWAEICKTRTLSGYNPLLEDYLNTMVLTS